MSHWQFLQFLFHPCARILFVPVAPRAAILLFGKREPIMCAVCGRELKHKYKPKEEWKMEGYLCSDCHIEKMKEFASRPRQQHQQQKEEPDYCAVCKAELGDVAVKPRWQWEMEPGSMLCQPCFGKKDAEFNKRLNFCSTCGAKLGVFRYNPKPAWKIQGQMCRKCWDERNQKK